MQRRRVRAAAHERDDGRGDPGGGGGAAATTVNVKRASLSRVMSAMLSAADTARSNLSSCQPSKCVRDRRAVGAGAARTRRPAADNGGELLSDPRCADPRRQTSQPQRLSAAQMWTRASRRRRRSSSSSSSSSSNSRADPPSSGRRGEGRRTTMMAAAGRVAAPVVCRGGGPYGAGGGGDFRGGGGRGMAGTAGGRGGGRQPPPNYVCFKCNKPGHFIQFCPATEEELRANVQRRAPVGIPRTQLVDAAGRPTPPRARRRRGSRCPTARSPRWSPTPTRSTRRATRRSRASASAPSRLRSPPSCAARCRARSATRCCRPAAALRSPTTRSPRSSRHRRRVGRPTRPPAPRVRCAARRASASTR